jgi:ketosteroid isomerase-like protein
MSVEVYDGVVGVAHYTFEAEVAAPRGKTEKVSGRWTEVYLKKDNEWLMISVEGGSK